jgi:hypothetical protein
LPLSSNILFETFPAGAVQDYVFGFYPPQLPDIVWQDSGVERLPLKIYHLFTAFTDKMVVLRHFRLKARLALHGLNPFNQVMPLKGIEGAINRIKGNGRHPSKQPFVKCFGRGMVNGPGKFTKDLEPLVGQSESGCLACPHKTGQFFLQRLWLVLLRGHEPLLLLLIILN